MKIIRSRKFIVSILFLIFAGFLIFRNFTSGSKTKKIDSTKVRQGKLEDVMTISGSLDAEEQATLRFQTSGRLVWVGVKEGDFVKKYQSIASLDQSEVKKNLEKELNNYLKTRWDFDQAHKDTYKDQVMTDPIKRILDKTQFDLNKSVLDVELQNLSVEYAYLWSPIEGLVTHVSSPFAGVNITPSQADFEIINPKTIYFSAAADQSEVVKLSEKMAGELTLDAYPQATFSGTISNISFIPKSGESGTVYKVKFFFANDNTDYKYRLGMAGDLSFVTESKDNVLYIPSKYIKNDSGKKYLTVKRKDKEEKVYVETGMETDIMTEITSGISSGETVYD